MSASAGAASAPRPWLRLVLAVSLDGRLAPPCGGAAQIGGPGDRRVLEEALAWCDAALVGAETLRRHRSTCLIRDSTLLAHRRQEGRSPQPIAIVVSRTGALPPDLPFFRQPLERWLLAASPGPAAEAAAAAPPPGFGRTVLLHSWPAALADLARLGIHRLDVLGGASLAASLVAEDLLDELQLTLCPQLLGGEHSWLPAWSLVPPAGPGGWHLVESRPLEGEELLLRYCREDRERS